MGDWTDAMEDGVICSGCQLPLGRPTGEPTFCESCKAEGRDKAG